MTTFKFKTNINCNGCIATVTPFLNSETTIQNWKVDIQNPNKILTVEGEKISKDMVVSKVKEAGFKIEDF
ncbi:heavy-metal-associated domain-containing protein [bacterium]|nr:heavy-metal-associated domain-containing protein [bacterium]